MAESALGVLLKYLRENRGLNPRELAAISGVDHAYIYRLESGEKDSPSEDILSKLIKALKPDQRHKEMLRFLAQNPGSDPPLTETVMKDPGVSMDVFIPAATIRHRGNVRPDPETLIKRVRMLLDE